SPHRFNTLGTQLGILALRKNQTSLPIVGAVERNQDSTTPDTAIHSTADFQILRRARKPGPKHVHGRGSLGGSDARQLAQLGEAAVGTHRQRSAHLMPAIRSQIKDSEDDTIFLNQFARVGTHYQLKGGIFRRLSGDEFQKSSLWDHQDVRESG